MLTALQALPRDAELLAFEAGYEDYYEREAEDVEWQGGRVYLHLAPAGTTRHAARRPYGLLTLLLASEGVLPAAQFGHETADSLTYRDVAREGHGRGAGLAADLSAEDVLHGRRGCPGLWFGLQVDRHDQLAAGVRGAEGCRPIALQRPAVPP
jgi:hypothetical protein